MDAKILVKDAVFVELKAYVKRLLSQLALDLKKRYKDDELEEMASRISQYIAQNSAFSALPVSFIHQAVNNVLIGEFKGNTLSVQAFLTWLNLQKKRMERVKQVIPASVNIEGNRYTLEERANVWFTIKRLRGYTDTINQRRITTADVIRCLQNHIDPDTLLK